MDGVFEGSLWSLIIQIVDSADHVFSSEPYVLASLGSMSLYYTFLGSWLDLFLIASFLVFRQRPLLASLTVRIWHQLYFTLVSGMAVACAAFIILSALNRKVTPWTGPGRPYLIPCKTTHTRLFPRTHSFNYSYLVVGIPIEALGNFNGMITVQNGQSDGFSGLLTKIFCSGWYSIDSSDYLQRGACTAGLRGKLNAYLQSQGEDPDDYPHAYLVTAAKFLGYHFNPVSFWYLYTPDRILSAIVLEVNNTFGERRPYLILRDFSTEAEYLKGLTSSTEPPSRVKGSWPKDFHVSPFNSMKGTYSVLANDPMEPGMGSFKGIDITISLSSSKGKPKLITRLYSEGDAVDPNAMTPSGKCRFLLGWSWIGFATFPRIVKEAAVLFFKRKLHVWYRPEPLRESLGRHATHAEKTLEIAFRSYLKFRLEQSQKPLSVRYISSGITDRVEENLFSPSATDDVPAAETLEMKVLTPLFYERFVHYAHDFEALFTEMTESGTIWTDKPHLMPDIFLKNELPPLHAASAADYICFKLIQNLRRRPNPIPRVLTSADPPAIVPAVVDIREFRISSMDAYMIAYAEPKLRASYRSTVLRLLIADNYFLGSIKTLDFCIFVFRTCLALLMAFNIGQAMGL